VGKKVITATLTPIFLETRKQKIYLCILCFKKNRILIAKTNLQCKVKIYIYIK
jgi:hypothetical protein